MSASGFTLRLEYVAESIGCEPVELVQEFPIDTYEVGDPTTSQGTAIVGVEIITHGGFRPTYRFYRARSQAMPQSDDPAADIRCVVIKLRWDDPADPTQPINGFYASRVPEVVEDNIPDSPINGRWLLVLKQAGATNLLVYQLDSGPGNADPCQDLEVAGIDCTTTKIKAQKLTCKARLCKVGA